MNFKKYILSLLAILFLSMPAIAEKNHFLGEGEEVVKGAGRQNWNGYANIFKANADEILEATN